MHIIYIMKGTSVRRLGWPPAIVGIPTPSTLHPTPTPHHTQGKRKRKKAMVYNGSDPKSRPPTRGYAFVYSIYKDPLKFRSSTPIPPTGSNIKVVFKIWFTIISEVTERQVVEK